MESGTRILIVEDDESVRLSLALLLETFGLTVVATTSGAEALAASVARFDIFLIDMGLGDMDGAALATRLRRGAPDTPAILMSADSDRLSRAAPFAACLLDKPISAPAMMRAIQKIAPDAMAVPPLRPASDGLHPPG